MICINICELCRVVLKSISIKYNGPGKNIIGCLKVLEKALIAMSRNVYEPCNLQAGTLEM